MVAKKKVSLGGGSEPKRGGSGARYGEETVEFFFNSGVVFHELGEVDVPDTVAGFLVVKDPTSGEVSGVRRAAAGEESHVEISAIDHVSELAPYWLPVPYQLSCAFCVQARLMPDAEGNLRAVMAIDTCERQGSAGRRLDATLDEGRAFRPLDRNEIGALLENEEMRELFRRLERAGVDRAMLKYAAWLEAMQTVWPKLLLRRISPTEAIGVSLVLDFGNSRSSAVLVEPRESGVSAVPLQLRSRDNPMLTSSESFDSRVTLLPAPFDKFYDAVAVADSFTVPSVARLGREALDRALETPHRYACTLSGPKRYLWDDRNTSSVWHFAQKRENEYRPISGRILKYIDDELGGLGLRQDGPSAPAEPRYASRTMMLFAIAEILCQAIAQVNGLGYRTYQGNEGHPRFLKHMVLTYPSAMPAEERAVYETLVQNAVMLVTGLLGLAPEHRPNYDPARNAFTPFLFVDEALAAQMVYVYQEIQHTFSGSMEELVGLFGRRDGTLRVASVDIGGGTTDVMIAEYTDRLPGTGTALSIEKLFQDGVSIAGDEVCRAIVEDIVLPQVAEQIPSAAGRAAFRHLFDAGDAGHGAAWETLRARLVPNFWMPLARCYWALGEGARPADIVPERPVNVDDALVAFGHAMRSESVLEEADAFISRLVEGFPGWRNLVFRFDPRDTDRAALRVLREPLRRYADIIAQFDVDVLVLAGRASALSCVQELFVREMPVARARIKPMGNFRVGEWYPSKWRENGKIRDPKSTVTAGAAVLHLALHNRLPGFLIDRIGVAPSAPIFGLYQSQYPRVARANELFSDGDPSQSFVYTAGMRIGFRNVDSEEMDGSPLFEVRPKDADVRAALLEDRVALRFSRGKNAAVAIAEVASQRGTYQYEKTDFVLALKTLDGDRYWLDTGVLDTRVRENS